MILENFIKALFLTEIIEASTAYLLGYRGKKFYIVLMLINVLTNPLLNFILIVLYYFHIESFIITPVLEAFVVIGEWKLYEYALGKCERSYLILSLITNLSSYLIGLALGGRLFNI